MDPTTPLTQPRLLHGLIFMLFLSSAKPLSFPSPLSYDLPEPSHQSLHLLLERIIPFVNTDDYTTNQLFQSNVYLLMQLLKPASRQYKETIYESAQRNK